MYVNTVHCIISKINSEAEEKKEEEEEENLSWNVSFIHRWPVSKQPENMTLPTRRSEARWKLIVLMNLCLLHCIWLTMTKERKQAGGWGIHKKCSKCVEINQPQGFLFLCLPLGVCECVFAPFDGLSVNPSSVFLHIAWHHLRPWLEEKMLVTEDEWMRKVFPSFMQKSHGLSGWVQWCDRLKSCNILLSGWI